MFSELIIASHNEGKVREMRDLLAPFEISVNSAAALNLEEPEETGTTFEANAQLKADAACAVAQKACLADDSGLCVKALNDDPGIYSARWAGPNKDFAMAMAEIETKLHEAGVDPQGAEAYFVCVLALAVPGETTKLYRGEVHGTLSFPASGAYGFGYDPIFVPNESNAEGLSFGEMQPDVKHRMSHRAVAFTQFTTDIEAANG